MQLYFRWQQKPMAITTTKNGLTLGRPKKIANNIWRYSQVHTSARLRSRFRTDWLIYRLCGQTHEYIWLLWTTICSKSYTCCCLYSWGKWRVTLTVSHSISSSNRGNWKCFAKKSINSEWCSNALILWIFKSELLIIFLRTWDFATTYTIYIFWVRVHNQKVVLCFEAEWGHSNNVCNIDAIVFN